MKLPALLFRYGKMLCLLPKIFVWASLFIAYSVVTVYNRVGQKKGQLYEFNVRSTLLEVSLLLQLENDAIDVYTSFPSFSAI